MDRDIIITVNARGTGSFRGNGINSTAIFARARTRVPRRTSALASARPARFDFPRFLRAPPRDHPVPVIPRPGIAALYDIRRITDYRLLLLLSQPRRAILAADIRAASADTIALETVTSAISVPCFYDITSFLFALQDVSWRSEDFESLGGGKALKTLEIKDILKRAT